MRVPARLVRAALAVGVVAATIVCGHAAADAAVAILGGGSGFAALEIEQWRGDTARSPYNLSINYVAQGSTFGRQQFSQGTFDYGVSDIQYVDAEKPDLQRHRCGGRPLAQCFVYVPVSAGGLAFMYNLTDGSGAAIRDLKLTRQAACKIFTGAITKWNDPELVALNPRLSSVGNNIKAIVRADGAGESYVFSEFCIAVAPKVWSGFIAEQKSRGLDAEDPLEFNAGQPTSVWPQGGWGVEATAVPYADQVAGYVADPVNGKNAITYVAAGYAVDRGTPMASLQNASGVFTQPNEQNVTVALGYASPRGNGTFQLHFDGPDRRAYFPSTYSYVLAQTAGFNSGKGATLGRFLCYAVSQGQVAAPQLGYARLSSALVNIAEDAIVQIPGAPAKASCFVAGAPPPPPPPVVQPGGGGGGGGGGGPGTTVPGGGSSQSGRRGTIGTGTGSTLRARTSQVCNTPAKATTTTTARRAVLRRCTTATSQRGGITDAGGVTGGTADDLNARLDQEAARAPAGGSHESVIWVLLAGVAAMCAVEVAWTLRRTAL